MRSATLADVARAAGVSVSLVSLVLSGKGATRCSQETEEKIRTIAKKLGYRANRLARGLKEQQTRTIGLLSIEVATTPYAGELLLAAQRTARSHDYDLFFVEVDNSEKSIGDAVELMIEHQVAGLLITSFFHQEIKMPKVTPKNLVFANCYGSKAGYATYIPSEYTSFMQVLKVLGIAGHKDVAFITDGNPWPAVLGRIKAFRDAAFSFGWQGVEERIYKVQDSTSDDGYRATLELMLRDPNITAIACYNDRIAMGAYQALNELKISVPEQVSVVGFDDLELISGGLRPGLTTVRLPHYPMGREAVEHLIRICEGRDEQTNRVVEIRGELVVRDSVSFPRASNEPHNSQLPNPSLQKEEK